jgi:hypothetical protein
MICYFEVKDESVNAICFNFVSLWNATSQIKSSQARMILDVLVWWPWMLTMITDAQYSKVTVHASSKESMKSILDGPLRYLADKKYIVMMMSASFIIQKSPDSV